METIDKIINESRASIEKSDLRMLLRLLFGRSIKSALEIGAWKGFSAELWIKVFGLRNFITIEKGPKEIRESYIKDLGIQYWYDCDSHDPKVVEDVKIYLDKGIDFLFIDGDHRYDGVKRDFELYSPLVKPGGVIVFHDVCYEGPTEHVKVFWEEIRDKSYVEIRTSPNSTGIGVLFI